MGSPVITKAGNTYVSRMSTAVLEGCGLNEWVASDEHSYVQLAVDMLPMFTTSSFRDQWRQQIKSSPLGDAADLMHHLERAFTAMVDAKIKKS